MSKRKKAVLAVGLVLAAFLIGAIIFYMHFIMNAGQTIEKLQKLVAGNGYEITADCAMTFEPSDQLKPVTDLVQELLNTDSLTAKFTATGDSAQKNLKLQLKENITDKQTSLTTFYLVDGKCYFGIDSIISALAGDEIDKSFLLKAAYNGWIKDHCVTLEQLTSLIYDLTGVTVENSLKMPGGMDAVLFLAEPDHLFDPKLWSAVKVSGKNDGASEFTIDADGNCLQTEVHAAANKLDEQNQKKRAAEQIEINRKSKKQLGRAIRRQLCVQQQPIRQRTFIWEEHLIMSVLMERK